MNTEFNLQLNPGAVKAAMKSAEASSRDLWQVAPDKLKVIEGFNVRVKDDAYALHIRSLADSMKAEGFYQDKPLSGIVERDGEVQTIYITDGHCRLEAAQLAISEGAELVKLPVVVNQAGVSREDLTVALVKSNAGKPLTTYEVAVVCKRLVRYGMEEKLVASRLGLTVQHVNGLLSLVASPYQLQKLVMDNVVSATAAIDAIAKYGKDALDRVLAAQAAANAVGKTRVTAKTIDPDAERNKRIRKYATQLYTLLKTVRDDVLLTEAGGLYVDVTELLDAIDNN